jgi:hypothetical protein
LDPAKGITHCKFIAINWQDGMIGLGGFCLNSLPPFIVSVFIFMSWVEK